MAQAFESFYQAVVKPLDNPDTIIDLTLEGICTLSKPEQQAIRIAVSLITKKEVAKVRILEEARWGTRESTPDNIR
eukprot:jgi/Ulvmu1/6502/UM003_0135.1